MLHSLDLGLEIAHVKGHQLSINWGQTLMSLG